MNALGRIRRNLHCTHFREVLTEAAIGDLQVPHIYPKIVCRNEMLPVAVRVYGVHMVRVGISKHPAKARRDRRACYGNLRQCQSPLGLTDSFFDCVRRGSRNSFHLLLANLPQLDSFICKKEEEPRRIRFEGIGNNLSPCCYAFFSTKKIKIESRKKTHSAKECPHRQDWRAI